MFQTNLRGGILFLLLCGLGIPFIGCSSVYAQYNSAPLATQRPPTAIVQATSDGGVSLPSRGETPLPTQVGDDTVTSEDATPRVRESKPEIPAGMSRVMGRVRNAAGDPLAYARVTVPQGTSVVPERAALTNTKGDYVWILPPGAYTLQVNADGYQPAQAQVTTLAEQTTTQDFWLAPE